MSKLLLLRMWIVVNYGDSKKLALEIVGDETVHDIMRVLHLVYHFPKRVQLTYKDHIISEKQGPILNIDQIKDRPEEEADLIELKISKGTLNDPNEKGPTGEVNQDADISVGRYFKNNDKLSPSSINQSLSKRSRGRQPSLKQ